MRGRALHILVVLCSVSTPSSAQENQPPRDSATTGAERSDAIRASLDGQLRLRGEFLRTPELGFARRDSTNLLLLRALLGLKLKFFSFAQARLQLGSAQNLSSDPVLRPFDEDSFYLQEAYLDLSIRRSETQVSSALRLGRQQLPLGSSRLVGVRDGPNVRLSFDGVRWDIAWGPIEVQSFGMLEVEVRPGAFDDRASSKKVLWGTYGTFTPRPLGLFSPAFDVYYLGTQRNSLYREITAVEWRHSVGTRVFGTWGALDYNWEVVLQLGSFATQYILAWTAASDQGLTYSSDGWSARVGVRANTSSGDPDPHDSALQTFNPLYPKLPYFSELSLLSPMNHQDIHPTVRLKLGENLEVFASYLWFYKQRRRDDVYAPSGEPIGESQATQTRPLGQQLNGEVTFQASAQVNMAIYYSYFGVSSALRELGAVSSSLVLFWTNCRF